MIACNSVESTVMAKKNYVLRLLKKYVLIQRSIQSSGLLKALHTSPPGRGSFQPHLDFSGKHSATLQLLREDYSFRYPLLSVAGYSFIQLRELWQRGMNEIAKVSKRQQEDSNPGSPH